VIGAHPSAPGWRFWNNGNLVGWWYSRPYGEPRSEWQPEVQGPYRYTGAVQHSNATAHLGARDYEAWSGLWLQADTIIPDQSNPQSLNRYSYSYNNPLKYVDPSGRCPEAIAGNDFACGGYWQFWADWVGQGDPLGWDPDWYPGDQSVFERGQWAGRGLAAWAVLQEFGLGGAVMALGTTASAGGGGLCIVISSGGCTPFAVAGVGAGMAISSVAGGAAIGHGASVGIRIATTDLRFFASADEPTATPRNLDAFPDAVRARPKTPVQGGGGLRPRWKGPDGTIYEYDRRHDTIEKYDKRGRHLGEFDYRNGRPLKDPDPTRRVEP
jgi:RHS repeat-associated protein